MLISGIISQVFLYLCFSVLIGNFLLYLIPPSKKPSVVVPKGILLGAISGIVIFSSIPVLKLILYMIEFMEMGEILITIISTFEVGKAWLFTLIVAVIFIIFVIFIDTNKYAYLGLIFTFLFILALGWSSHTASLDPVIGFLTHTTHVAAVSVWVGILFVVSWFSRDDVNWTSFLKWFSPIAIICFLSTIITGFFLMNFVIDLKDYSNSWMIPYGQSLLIKHILIIPLFVYALINSYLIKKKLALNPSFRPIPWARMESMIILLIFAATAALGEQSPPHEIVFPIEVMSEWFKTLYQGQVQPGMVIHLALNPISIIMLGFALLFLVFMIVSLKKGIPVIFSFMMGILLAVTVYLFFMLSIK